MTHRKAGRFAHALAGILCGCVIAGSSLTRVYAQELPDQTQNTPANGSRLTWTAPQGQQNTPLTLVALQKRLEQAQQELRVLQARRHYILKTMSESSSVCSPAHNAATSVQSFRKKESAQALECG